MKCIPSSWRVLAVAALLLLGGCGQTPETTQKARGLLRGTNLVLGMTVALLVAALLVLVGALAVDRLVRTRRMLETAPPSAEEPEEEVVAGIKVSAGGVPRWLYACYVLIPAFALVYVFSNVSIQAQTHKAPQATRAPTGPVTSATEVASQIQFTTKSYTVAAGKTIKITFKNEDPVPHTFTVWKSKAEADTGNTAAALADSGTITGPATKTVSFTAPAAGTSLYFNCIIHPQSMFGTITAK